MKKIITILGTRPEIIKFSPVIPLLDEKFNQIIVHTGQHYSHNMDRLFFEEIKLRDPDYCLEVGSGGHSQQTGKMIIGIEEISLKEKPDLILVQGDTNTTLSGALVAAKLGIPLAHIEAGYRSFNRNMPEEINRVITDQFSKYLFVGIQEGVEFLKKEGVSEGIYLVGNTAIDALLRNKEFADEKILGKLGLEEYGLVTVHRAENTNKNLNEIVEGLNELSSKIKLVFPIHPRTKKALSEKGLILSPNIIVTEPLGYLDFISLMKNAKLIMTDSGGIQEEAVELNVPCLVLRNETEAVEIFKAGKTRLAGVSRERIVLEAEKMINDLEEIKSLPFNGKKGVAKEIVEILERGLYGR